MIALGIRYLRGCAVSSDQTRQRAEFPPHPGRVFMAMAAAHFETRGEPEERLALEWLEALNAAPAISAPSFSERRPSHGRVLETYVPVNDKHGGIVSRSRQARSFPTLRLFHDCVFLIWEANAPDGVRKALDRLCAKVTRLGHSSSMVQMWVADETIQPNLVPSEVVSDRRMRVAELGTLAYLEKTFSDGARPRLPKFQGYHAVTAAPEPVANSVFDSNLIVFETVGECRVLGLESTLQLTSALRDAAMVASPDEKCPEWLSGHQADGNPSLKPHVAFFPLPFVGTRYADGHVLGLAMAIPRTVPDVEARRVLGPLLFNPESGEERQIRLWRNDHFWEWNLKRVSRDFPPIALRSATWTAKSHVWASITPVVLHHYPKKNRDGDVERILREAFESAGVPRPAAIRVQPASKLNGAPDARAMPNFTDGGAGLCSYQTHVVAEFEHPVAGPVLVGRGRFRGYGLFRPVTSTKERGDEYRPA